MEIRRLNGKKGIGEKAFHDLLVKIERQWHPEILIHKDPLLDYSQKIYEKSTVLGVVVSDEIVGFAAVYINNRETRQAYLTYIAFLEPFTRMGLGKGLLDQVITIVSDCGFTSIKLEVKKDNARARKFYKKQGFLELCDASENSIYMIRYLGGE